MLLDGIVDVVAYTASAEARTGNFSSSTDEVFDQFLTLCDRAGPARGNVPGNNLSPTP